MDFATIVGIILALILIGLGVGFNLGPLWDPPSAAIVFGGVFGAMFIGYPFKTVFGVFKIIGKSFKPPKTNGIETINLMVTFAEKARRDGLLSLESEIDQVEDPFLKRALQMVVDGTDPELVRNILDNILNAMEERHGKGKALLKYGATMGPAFGMIGTLLGLIIMLGNLSDVSSLGPNMAVAIITTLYGSLLANVIFDPMANKVEYYSRLEVKAKEMIIDGVLSIQSGDNPKILREKLVTFLDPQEAKKFFDQQEGE